MSFQFDHYVHLVKDPEQVAEQFRDLGIHTVEGGKHEYLGTYNFLSYFGLSYIEFIGIFDEDLVKEVSIVKYSLRDTIVENKFEEGPQRIALRHNNLEEVAERFRALGLEVNGPSNFSRKRPDGSLVTWKLLFAGKPSEPVNLPFFIQWDENNEDRLSDLQQRGVIVPHKKDEIEVDGAAFAVKEIENIPALWSDILQLEKSEIYEEPDWNARAQRLKLRGGDIIFYEPIGEGTVQNILNTKGEGLFALQFKGGAKSSSSISNSNYRFI